jgi:hypothetical protein
MTDTPPDVPPPDAPLRIGATILRWMLGWAAFGLALGLVPMFSKDGFSDSDRGQGTFLDYAFWLPLGAIAGALGGAVMGTVFTGLMMLTDRWPRRADGSLPLTGTRQRMVCGMAAGALVGLFFGSPAMSVLLMIPTIVTSVLIRRP